jgi:hypothetical protein
MGERTGEILAALVAHMSPGDLKAALEFIREWNTNARHCHAAHAMLRAILQHHAPPALLAVPGAGELLEALAAYTGRHLGRVERLLRSSFLLDATLASMQVGLAGGGGAGGGGWGAGAGAGLDWQGCWIAGLCSWWRVQRGPGGLLAPALQAAARPAASTRPGPHPRPHLHTPHPLTRPPAGADAGGRGCGRGRRQL